MRIKKARRQFTPEELVQIEVMTGMDMSDECISALLGMSDTWFSQLKKKYAAVRLAKRLGKAKASLAVRQRFWEKINSGDWKAIEFQLKTKEGYMVQERMELTGANGGPITFTDFVKALQEKEDDEED